MATKKTRTKPLEATRNRDIFRGSRLPKSGKPVPFGFIFSCQVKTGDSMCEYERSFETEEAAKTAKLMHCRAAGVTHDAARLDLLWNDSRLSDLENSHG